MSLPYWLNLKSLLVGVLDSYSISPKDFTVPKYERHWTVEFGEFFFFNLLFYLSPLFFCTINMAPFYLCCKVKMCIIIESYPGCQRCAVVVYMLSCCPWAKNKCCNTRDSQKLLQFLFWCTIYFKETIN